MEFFISTFPFLYDAYRRRFVPQPPHRSIRINEPQVNFQVRPTSNEVHSAKYTFVNFIPKNLFEQFHRIANIYFLIISILQLTTNLSPTNKLATVGPLSAIMFVNMVKEAYEDWLRHQNDAQINQQACRVLRDGLIMTSIWQDLRPGDLCIVDVDTESPADILVLHSAHRLGHFYVETANLDGETNLKVQYSLNITQTCDDIHLLSNLRGMMTCEHPNNSLYTFSGALKLEGSDSPVSVDSKNLMLRGTVLRNTHMIYGLVINTGNDTKLIQNSRATPSKRSHLESEINKLILYIFACLGIFCAYFATNHILWSEKNRGDLWYLDSVLDESQASSSLSFITFLILFNNLTPISLYISMELVRIYQARFIESDLEMYDDVHDVPAIARTSNLNEELGQVRYILTDKTGTLTCNEMTFLKCIVGADVMSMAQMEMMSEERVGQYPGNSGQLNSETLLNDEEPSPSRFTKWDYFEYFNLTMALCHSAVPSRTGLKSSNRQSVIIKTNSSRESLDYQSTSPDEVALLNAARNCGFIMEERSQTHITVRVQNERRQYKILAVNEFSSQRKRMSIIVQDPRGGYLLFCKGADTIMMDLINRNQPNLIETMAAIEEFAEEGLRTLVMAMKVLTADEYAKWSRNYLIATTSLSKREEVLAEVAAELEQGLYVLGASAVEDRLQDKVADTIDTLMAAGIKVWMLTGDKQETAINIAISTRLFPNQSNVVKLNSNEEERILGTIEQAYRKHFATGENAPVSLVIDGSTLQTVLGRSTLKEAFLKFATFCQAVVACRVSPSQKAQIVNIVKRQTTSKCYTLAIGDGGNDVNMIQEAHIGVGICGKEGMQAVLSSDFAISEFRFLAPLLLKHGKWNYYRMCRFVYYSFYKNAAFVTMLALYASMTGFSGTTLFESWLGSLWNVLWTFLPVIVLAVLDQDVKYGTIQQLPFLYVYGSHGFGFNMTIFLKWFFHAIAHGAIISRISVLVLSTIISPDGYSDDLWTMGTCMNGALMLTVTMKIIVETKSFTVPFVGVVVLSVCSWFIFVIAYSFMYSISPDFYGVGTSVIQRPVFWMLLPLTTVSCLIFELIVKMLQYYYFPTPIEIARELELSSRNESQTANQDRASVISVLPQGIVPTGDPREAFSDRRFDRIKSKNSIGLDPMMSLVKTVIQKLILSDAAQNNLKVVKVHSSRFFQSSYENQHNSISQTTLEFHCNPPLEKEFQQFFYQTTIGRTRYTWIIVYLLYFLMFIVFFEEQSSKQIGPFGGVASLLVSGLYTVFFLSNKTESRYQLYIAVFYIIIFYMTVTIISWPEKILVQALKPFFGFIAGGLRFKIAFWIVTIDIFAFVVETIVVLDSINRALHTITMVLLAWAISGRSAYQSERSMRKNFLLQRAVKLEKQHTRNILETMLPPFVVNQIQGDIQVISHLEPSVTVLFCEIMDFGEIVAESNQTEFVSMLDSIFSHFDSLCIKHDVQKIETVGPIYMACAGLRHDETNHAFAITRLAEAMLNDILDFNRPDDHPLRIRIGLNTGPVVSGVVGKKKPQYCLFGDTVNTASRMESSAPAMSIQVTESTYKMIHSYYPATERKVYAKGKGEMKTYVIDLKATRRVKQKRSESQIRVEGLFARMAQFLPEPKRKIDMSEAIENQFTNPFTLHFRLKQDEDSFRSLTDKTFSRSFYSNIFFFFSLFTIYTIIEAVGDEKKISSTYIMPALLLVYIPVVVVANKLPHLQFIFPYVACLAYFHIALFICLNSALNDDRVEIFVTLGVTSAMTFFFIYGGLTFLHGFLLCLVISMMLIVFIASDMAKGSYNSQHEAHAGNDESSKNDPEEDDKYRTKPFFLIAYTVIYFSLNALSRYSRELENRKIYLLERQVKSETAMSNELLNYMAPPSILKQLRAGNKVSSQTFENVAILCSDIAGFTMKSSQSEPVAVVQLLSTLFSHFDVLTSIHEVFKVQTIGDAYIAVAGIPLDHTDTDDSTPAAHKLMKFAIGMLSAIRDMVTPDGDHVRLRIGLHYGTIIGGVLGSQTVRFDIWGRDVLTATQMESKGVVGKLHMSEAFKLQIEDKYDVTIHDQVQCNGESCWTYIYDPFES